MSTITSRKVVGALMLTALALQYALGGDPGSGTGYGIVSDSTTNTTATNATLAGDSSGGKASKSSKTSKTDKNAPKFYWLTQHVDAVTDSGVTGYGTGTKVTWISTGKDGTLKVKSDDNIVFEVTKDQVTDDPNQAAALAQQQADQEAAQAAARAQQQQAAALAAALQPAPVIVLPTPVAQAPASSGGGSLVGTSLDKGSYDQVVSPKPKPRPPPPPPVNNPPR